MYVLDCIRIWTRLVFAISFGLDRIFGLKWYITRKYWTRLEWLLDPKYISYIKWAEMNLFSNVFLIQCVNFDNHLAKRVVFSSYKFSRDWISTDRVCNAYQLWIRGLLFITYLGLKWCFMDACTYFIFVPSFSFLVVSPLSQRWLVWTVIHSEDLAI